MAVSTCSQADKIEPSSTLPVETKYDLPIYEYIAIWVLQMHEKRNI